MNTKIDITGITLKTKRLLLRPFKLTDLDDFFEYASVPGVGEMAGWEHHTNKEKSLQILNMFIEEKKTFAITKDDKVIGSLGIEDYKEAEFPELDKFQVKELGFVLSKDYWGQALMPEACEVVINYLFDVEKLDYLTCAYFQRNSQSKRVQEKLGFKFHHTGYYVNRMGETLISDFMIMSNQKK